LREGKLTVLNTWVTLSLLKISSAEALAITADIRPVNSINLNASTSIAS